jgi:hypothetical protein
MIDMNAVFQVLDDIIPIAEDLHGTELTDLPEEDSSSSARSKQELRTRKVAVSRDLLILADGFGYAEQLVRQQYWAFKGAGDGR